MWPIIVVAGIAISAIGKAVYEKYFSNKEKKAKKEWQENREKVEKYILQQEIEIQEYNSNKNTEEDFYNLTNIHFTSMKIADQAYRLFDYSKIYLEAMNRNLKLTADRKNKIENLFNTKIEYKKKLKLTEELNELKEIRRALFGDKDTLRKQTDDLKNKLKSFNIRTSTLKFRIRDNCGEKGLDWFERMEQRKRNRK
jgi:hypothetical protein